VFARCAPRGLSHNPLRYSYGYPYSYSYGEYPYGYGGYGPDYSYYYNSYAAAQIAYEADAQQAAEGEQSRADWEAYRNSLPEAPLQRGLHKIYAWVWVHGDWDAETARREVDAVTQAVEREPLFYDGLVLVHLVEIGMVTDSPWFRPHPGLYLNKTMADLYAPLMAAARRYGIELHGFITAVPSILTAPDVNRTSEVPPRSWFSANVSAGTPMGPLIDSSTDIAAALGLAGFSTDDESTGSPRLAPGESEAWFAFHDAWGKGLRSRGLVLSTAVQVHVHRTVLAQAALTARRPVLRHASALPCLTDESQAMSWMHVDDREDKSTQAGPRAPPRVARASENTAAPACCQAWMPQHVSTSRTLCRRAWRAPSYGGMRRWTPTGETRRGGCPRLHPRRAADPNALPRRMPHPPADPATSALMRRGLAR